MGNGLRDRHGTRNVGQTPVRMPERRRRDCVQIRKRNGIPTIQIAEIGNPIGVHRFGSNIGVVTGRKTGLRKNKQMLV